MSLYNDIVDSLQPGAEVVPQEQMLQLRDAVNDLAGYQIVPSSGSASEMIQSILTALQAIKRQHGSNLLRLRSTTAYRAQRILTTEDVPLDSRQLHDNSPLHTHFSGNQP